MSLMFDVGGPTGLGPSGGVKKPVRKSAQLTSNLEKEYKENEGIVDYASDELVTESDPESDPESDSDSDSDSEDADAIDYRILLDIDKSLLRKKDYDMRHENNAFDELSNLDTLTIGAFKNFINNTTSIVWKNQSFPAGTSREDTLDFFHNENGLIEVLAASMDAENLFGLLTLSKKEKEQKGDEFGTKDIIIKVRKTQYR